MSVRVGIDPSSFEEFLFYRGEIRLRYDDAAHVYLLVLPNGQLREVPSVTTVVKIVDKSDMLVPWGVKMAAEKLLANVPTYVTKAERRMVPAMPYEVFLTLVTDAKSAHKERLEDAANVGKDAHSWLQRYIQHQLGLNPVPEPLIEPRAASCTQAALDWMQQHNVRWLQTERKIYSRQYGYAGTMDGLCLADSCTNLLCCPESFKDSLSLVDWKSSNYLYLTYLFQTASYSQAVTEEFGSVIARRWLVRLGKEDGQFEVWHLGPETQDRDVEGFLACLDLSFTMKDLKARQAEAEDARKEAAREQKRLAKEAAHRIACPKSKTYKGSRRTVCIDGQMCQACEKIFLDKHPDAVQ